MIKKVLKDNRGEAYIGHIIGIILSLVVVVFALTYYPVFTLNCRKAPFFRCGDERQGFNYFNKICYIYHCKIT